MNSGFVLRHAICLLNFKAWSGIEPLNSGFADHCLTTWLPRHSSIHQRAAQDPRKIPSECEGQTAALPLGYAADIRARDAGATLAIAP